MSGLIEEIINSIQDINARVDGVVSAPFLTDYPTTPDTMEMPLVLTEQTTGTEWSIECANSGIQVALNIIVLLRPINQEDYGINQQDVVRLEDNFRRKYRDSQTYLYEDGERKLLFENSAIGQAWVNAGVKPTFSGYMLLERPVRSGRWFHGFRMTLRVSGRESSC
jgi:hypothetical protein